MIPPSGYILREIPNSENEGVELSSASSQDPSISKRKHEMKIDVILWTVMIIPGDFFAHLCQLFLVLVASDVCSLLWLFTS